MNKFNKGVRNVIPNQPQREGTNWRHFRQFGMYSYTGEYLAAIRYMWLVHYSRNIEMQWRKMPTAQAPVSLVETRL
jgi:hypothetical protein